MKSYGISSIIIAFSVGSLLFGLSPALAKKPTNPGGGKPGGGGAPYSIIPFEPVGSTSLYTWVSDVNEQETVVVGGVQLPSGEYQSSYLDLTTGAYAPFATGFDVNAVNNHKRFVGNIGSVAAYWDSTETSPVTLPPLAGYTSSYALAINDSGIVLGESRNHEDYGIGVVWRVTEVGHEDYVVQGPYALPPILSSDSVTRGFGINEVVNGKSQISGYSYGNAVVWTIEIDASNQLIPPLLTDVLGTLNRDNPTWSEGRGINQSGDVVGQSDGLPFLTASGEPMVALQMPHKANSGYAVDINDAGVIVGDLHTPKRSQCCLPSNYDAYLWQDGQQRSLLSLIESNHEWGQLNFAGEITNGGVITGHGHLENGPVRGFLMIPNGSAALTTLVVPEPNGMLILGVAPLVAFVFFLRASSKLTDLVALSYIAFFVAPHATRAAEFIPLGHESFVEGVAGNGAFAVGWGSRASVDAIRWSLSGDVLMLGDLAGACCTEAEAASFNGSVVVGSGSAINNASEAIRWTQTGGMQGLGTLPGDTSSRAWDTSADGSIVVGESWNASVREAFLWTDGIGMIGLGMLPGHPESSARSVSADGSVVVGESIINSSTGTYESFRWSETEGMQGLGSLLGSTKGSVAIGISADGSTIVGTSDSTEGYQAFRWTHGFGMIGLGDLPGGRFHSEARAVSADGSIIVGHSSTKFSMSHDEEAFIWDAANGMRLVKDLLTDAGVNIDGWQLEFATGISDDGTVIGGWGINPMGDEEAWLARLVPSTTVPEPQSILLILFAALLIPLRNLR